MENQCRYSGSGRCFDASCSWDSMFYLCRHYQRIEDEEARIVAMQARKLGYSTDDSRMVAEVGINGHPLPEAKVKKILEEMMEEE